MMNRSLVFGIAAATALLLAVSPGRTGAAGTVERRLYVGVPGIRDYTEYGGVGILVFDVEHGHRWVKRIPTWESASGKPPEAVKGICASAETGRLYVSTPTRLLCIDLLTEKRLWEATYPGGCDRMALSPDGKTLYVPALEGPHWNVVDAPTGRAIARIETQSGSHNTICSPDGKRAYLAGLKSPTLFVADTTTHAIAQRVGPFGSVIRPFTINASQTLCFVNVNDLLGFEVGDLTTGKVTARVRVAGFEPGPTKRHGCPSHGVALTPDERELWLTDAHNERLHVFDATKMPPVQVATIALRDQPGWVTFGIDGRYAYPSTGEVIDSRSRAIVAALKDEMGRPVQSEKLLEIDFRDGKPVRTGDQFGIGRKK